MRWKTAPSCANAMEGHLHYDTMTREAQDRQFQIEHLTHQLVEMLMDERGMTMEQAMDTIYSSHTFEKVENARTGLFFQSAVYVMDMLNEELNGA